MEDDFLSFNIEYRFSSFISSREATDCIKEYRGIIYSGEYADNSRNKYAGEIHFKILFLGQAEAEGLDIYELFDTYEYTFRHGQAFYDLNKGIFKKSIIKEFPDLEFGCSKICIIETIGIIPEFRGKNIGTKVFKDLIWNFGEDCALFILQPYPLQFEFSENNAQLLLKLKLKQFEKDKKKATASLSKHYQSWGFKKIKGVKDLLFYCPLYKNDVFDEIDMDDY